MQPRITVRHAACLVYAFKPRNDRHLVSDVSFAAREMSVDDELDVYPALDDLVAYMQRDEKQ